MNTIIINCADCNSFLFCFNDVVCFVCKALVNHMALQLLFQMSASLGLRWAWHFMCSHMLSSSAENFFSSGVGVTMKDSGRSDAGQGGNEKV